MNRYIRISRLNRAFQYVDDRFLDLVEKEREAGRRRHLGKIKAFLGTAAACVCLAVVLPGAALAYNWFGLRELILPEDGEKLVPDNAVISLSGYMESPESQAFAEWQEFLAHYDTDNRIADTVGNGVFVAEGREDWGLYYVYSYEMGEKLDEIAAKYGLKLHTEVNIVDGDDFIDRVGGCFMDREVLGGAYIYEDGYFGFDGEVELSGCGMTGFQFTRSVKGTFNEVMLTIGQAEDFTEWQYVAACGEPVLLALGPGKALILADSEECFITVNVLRGTEEGMTKEDLQELADKIDFRILEDVKTPEMKGDSMVE